MPVKFVLKEHYTSVPENTKPESILLTTRVNKPDPVSSTQLRFNDKNIIKLRHSSV